MCWHLLSELYSVYALNPDWFICMKWDSPWYLLWCSWMVPSIWCTLYTNKVIKGNAKLFTRISWCCLFSYFISELWGDGLWACPQLSSYSWWGCEYNMYCCWQNYTSNFMGKADVRELYYWSASVSVGHPAGALAIICHWVLLTWLTYTYRIPMSRWHSSQRVFTRPICMPIIFLDWAHQLMYDPLLIVISSSGIFAILGIGSGPSKHW